jgi:hypothetical protein
LRKAFAILFLSVHVFSLGGYRLVLGYLEARADQSLAQNLDDHQYDEAGLLAIKIPLHLPYAGSHSEFERCDGSISMNGIFYNYVKRRLCNDTLILLCIANNEKNRLQAANNDYAKTAADDPSSSHNDKALHSLLKLLLFAGGEDGNSLPLPLAAAPASHTIVNDNSTCSCLLPAPAQPPETA